MRFEWKKYPIKKWLFMIVLFPIVLMSVLFLVRGDNYQTFKQQERRTANEFLDEFSRRRTHLQSLIDIGLIVLETPEDKQQYDDLFEIVDQAERDRYIYSADSYYENWETVNQARPKLWSALISIQEMGFPLYTIETGTLYSNLLQAEWMEQNNISSFIFESQRDSLFLIQESLAIMGSLGMIGLFIYFFALPTFKEYWHQQYRFTHSLPISGFRILSNKFIFVSLIFWVMILCLLLTSGMMSLMFDRIPLLAQLNYPICFELGDILIHKPLWEMILWQLVIMYLLMLFSLIIILLINKYLVNELFSLGIYLTLVAFGSQISIVSHVDNVWWNPFNWFNITDHVHIHPSLNLLFAICLLILMLILLAILMFKIGLIPKSATSELTKHAISIKANNFLSRFEILKYRRSKLLLYILLSIGLLVLYLSVNQYIEFRSLQHEYQQDIHNEMGAFEEYKLGYESRFRKIGIEDFSKEILTPTLIEDIQNSEDIPKEHEFFVENLNSFVEDYFYLDELSARNQRYLEEFNQGEYISKRQDDLIQRQNDWNFFSDRTIRSEHIPMQNNIFSPNAYINKAIMEYYSEHGIPYDLPHGPYHTLFIPSYEESPRSGEEQPPAAIKIEDFERYLEAVSTPLLKTSALQQIQNFLASHSYLFLFIIVGGLLSQSYAREWEDGQPVRFKLVQPFNNGKNYNSKANAALFTIFIIVLVSVILLYLGGWLINGPGHIDSPFVRYFSKTLGDAHREFFNRIPNINQYMRIEPLWKYLIEGGLLLVIGLIFMSELSFLLSSILKNSWFSLFNLIIIAGIGILVSQGMNHSFLQGSPFTYLNIPEVVEGLIAQRNDYTLLTSWTGIGVLVLCSIVFRMIGRYIADRRRYI